MKKFILLTCSCISLSAAAQSPDFGFENWTNVPFSTTVQDPNGWASLNALSVATATAQSVFKETTAPYAGLISAKVVTVKVQGALIPNPYTGANLDTAGLLVVGRTQMSAPYVLYGDSYAWRPAVLSFASKYTPASGDSAFVLAFLTHWNGSTRDTVARGIYSTGATTSAYAITNLTLNYDPAFNAVMPDTQRIFVSSSIYNHFGAKLGSTFYVDAFSWSGYNSTNDLAGAAGNVSVYPVPAADLVNIRSSLPAATVRISDITGRFCGTFLMQNNSTAIDISSFVPGLYFYTILNNQNEIIHNGKFEVSR